MMEKNKEENINLDDIRPRGSLRWEEFKLHIGEGKTRFYVVAPKFNEFQEFIATGNFREDGDGWYEFIQDFMGYDGKLLTRRDYSSAGDHNMSRTNGYNDRFIFAYKQDAMAYLKSTEYTTALIRAEIFRHKRPSEVPMKGSNRMSSRPPSEPVIDPFHYEPKRVVML